MELFFDTESSGLPIWGAHYSNPKQPRVVQLGLVLSDRDQIYSEMCFLVKGAEKIDLEAEKTHGISVEMTIATGLKETTAAGLFFFMVSKADVLVAHNVDFDVLLLQSLFYRLGFNQFCSYLKEKPTFCTMRSSTEFCKLPGQYRGSFKWPKLEELHRILFSEELKGHHNALCDVHATRRCYYKLKEIL